MVKFLLTVVVLLFTTETIAADRTVDLEVTYKTVNFTGTPAKAIALNNQIPGPTLHFTEGDEVTINVHNHIDKGTAIHWHGLLVPWQMDGVSHVTQAPIPPGGVFHYKFTLKQSGTYWYHAHANLQEQQGLYGAIIIDPIKPAPYQYDKDYTVVLSDWSDTDPEQIYKNIKNDGDYYSPKFPVQPSLLHFLQAYKQATATERKELKEAFYMMQLMRMSPYDFSDVGYDTFLLNGRPPTHPWQANVKVGDVVRLRFINAGGSTLFRIKIPGTTVKMVHVQGNDAEPYAVENFTLAPAETYDVLVKIEKNQPYIIYGESNDKLGKVLGALITEPQQTIDYSKVASFPLPKPILMKHEHGMSGHHGTGGNSHHQHAMKSQHHEVMVENKNQNLKATEITNDPDKPVEVIKMQLSGWMGKYIWFLNGVPEYKAKPILIVPGKRYRFIFKNDTMMHHPMHLHGHWLILRNGYGQYDPKVHTIDVQPNATIIADFDADADTGFWYFHCHNVYHMKAGMANIVRYQGTPIPVDMDHHFAKSPAKVNGQVSLKDEEYNMRQLTAHPALWYKANEIEVAGNPYEKFYQMTFQSLIGPDYNKLQLYMDDAEIDHGKVESAGLDIFYWHLLDEFWAIKGGINYLYQQPSHPYLQPGIGIEGLMPFFIETNIRAYYHAGSAKLDAQFARDTQLTNNFFLRAEVRSILATKTVNEAGIGSGLNQMRYILAPYYRIMPGVKLFLEFEHDQEYGATKKILRQHGDATASNTLTLGIGFTF